jgi:hypothetical protein
MFLGKNLFSIEMNIEKINHFIQEIVQKRKPAYRDLPLQPLQRFSSF